MRLITFSLPAIAVVAILSVSFQRSIGYTRAQMKTEVAACPEATRILHTHLNRSNAQRIKAGMVPFPQCLAVPPQPVAVPVDDDMMGP